MDIQTNEIKEALEFYNIRDAEYIEKCYECIEFINKNANIKIRIHELFNILYIDENTKLSELWKIKNIEELFGKDCHPFITNILLLISYKKHSDNMKKYKLDKKQCRIHKERVKGTLVNDIYQRNYNGIRISQMLWGTYFINLKLIEVGRLQYEFCKNNPITNKEERCIKIHIPSDKKLDNKEVKKSLNSSKQFIKRYFKLNNPKYYCNSWLLSNQIRNLLGEDSNIAKFQDMFNINETEECIDDILNFVYNIRNINDYNNLAENTTLQRKVKKYLLEGKSIKKGMGILK